MKVLLITPWIKVGGSELLILSLAQELKKQGVTPTIAGAFCDLEGFEGRFDDLEILTPSSWIAKLSKKSRVPLLFLGIPALFYLVYKKRKEFDVINPHNFPGLEISIILNFKNIVWHFNEPAPVPFWWLKIERRLVKKVAIVTALDEGSAEKANKILGISPHIVLAGVDWNFWSQPCLQSKSNNTLLAVGKLHPQKNQRILIEMMNELPTYKLILVGEGPDKEFLQGRVQELKIEDRVEFLGEVESTKLRELYAKAKLVLFPALNQTWGLTPFEALCQSTLSLVSAQAGISRFLIDEDCGYVANPTKEDFLSAIKAMEKNEAGYLEKANIGREVVEYRMSWANFAMEMKSYYERAITKEL